MSTGYAPKVIECPYLYYPWRRKKNIRWIKLPTVETYLRSAETAFTSFALIDSGAIASFIQKEEADLLGLKPQKDAEGRDVTAEAEGAGGQFKCYEATVQELTVMKNGVPFQSYRGKQVLVPEKSETLPYSILGRDTIFKQFDITFRENSKLIVFKKR